jgi:hypothetical protein
MNLSRRYFYNYLLWLRREKGERKGKIDGEKGKEKILAFPLSFQRVYLIYIGI